MCKFDVINKIYKAYNLCVFWNDLITSIRWAGTGDLVAAHDRLTSVSCYHSVSTLSNNQMEQKQVIYDPVVKVEQQQVIHDAVVKVEQQQVIHDAVVKVEQQQII